MSGQAFKVERDCFFDVSGGFRSGLPLGDATGKRWNFRDKYSILILLDQHSVLHYVTSDSIFGISFFNGKPNFTIAQVLVRPACSKGCVLVDHVDAFLKSAECLRLKLRGYGPTVNPVSGFP